jgi:outer membrane protein assembly factor BamD (BamD/ComL family)
MAILRASSAALFLALSFAPYQCAREPDPNRRMEDDPAESVYNLAGRFKTEGKADARATTLKYVVERYPSSRFAKQARADLEEMGQPLPPPKD